MVNSSKIFIYGNCPCSLVVEHPIHQIFKYDQQWSVSLVYRI
jgi:hypothetical protein